MLLAGKQNVAAIGLKLNLVLFTAKKTGRCMKSSNVVDLKEDKQCTYNVTLGRICASIVTVEKTISIT